MSTLAEQVQKVEKKAAKTSSMIYVASTPDGLIGSIDGPQAGGSGKIGKVKSRSRLLTHINLNHMNSVGLTKDGWHMFLFESDPAEIAFWSRLIYGQDTPILFVL